MAITSEQLVEACKHFTTPPPNAVNVSNVIKEKMAVIKSQIMQETAVKMEESSKEVKDTLNTCLDLVQGLSNNQR
jgi:hypothetical protein